jgi:hypothetical protein
MIKFFRKIRYDLMGKNKTGKYFKYAIGEIVLVVIGILIALNLNNWNERRKINIEEVLILKSLHDNLGLTKKQSETNILKEKRLKADLLFLLNFTSNNSKLLRPGNLDSIFDNGIFQLGTDSPVINSYYDLKNTGKIGLIKNKNLREKFTRLEVSVNNVKEKIMDRLDIHQIRIDDIIEKDINFVLLSKSAIPELNIENEKPNDYNLILNNRRVRNLLTIKLRMTQGVQDVNKELYLDIVDLTALIKAELNMKK